MLRICAPPLERASFTHRGRRASPRRSLAARCGCVACRSLSHWSRQSRESCPALPTPAAKAVLGKLATSLSTSSQVLEQSAKKQFIIYALHATLLPHISRCPPQGRYCTATDTNRRCTHAALQHCAVATFPGAAAHREHAPRRCDVMSRPQPPSSSGAPAGEAASSQPLPRSPRSSLAALQLQSVWHSHLSQRSRVGTTSTGA